MPLWQQNGMEITHPLREWRKREGLKQSGAAARLGIKIPTLSRFETGKRTPSLSMAVRLSEQTGIPVDRFVKQDEPAE